MTTKITIAYSPDTDDAFMMQALKQKWIDWGNYDFTFTTADIQVLNDKAKDGVYDVTAISIAAYPSLMDQYLLMPIGASIGDGFGPVIIVREDSEICKVEDLEGRTIAVPGLKTSAYFTARALLGGFDPKPMLFSTIIDAVKSGEVEAGILIHEAQLDFAHSGVRKIDDLGNLWNKRFALPLPLGSNAIKRSLGEKTIAEVSALMKKSIEVGLSRREQTLKDAITEAKPGLDLKLGDRYIDMYVNRRSLEFQADVKASIALMFELGHKNGLCQAMSESDYLYS